MGLETVEFYIGAYNLSPMVTGVEYTVNRGISSGLIRVYLGILTLKKTKQIEQRLRPAASIIRTDKRVWFHPVYISFAGHVVTLRGVYHGGFSVDLYRLGDGKRPDYYRFYFHYRRLPLMTSEGRLVPDMRL